MRYATLIKVITLFLLVIAMTLTSDVINYLPLHRERRALVFPTGSVLQLSLGLSMPVSGVPNRSVTTSFGIQLNWFLPQNPVYFRTPAQINRRDISRKDALLEMYLPLEAFLEDHGFHGRTCLLRSICEAACSPFQQEDMGLLEEIMHTVLTPSEEILAEDADCNNTNFDTDHLPLQMRYLAAECLGKSDGDCLAAYPDCPKLPLDFISQKLDVEIFTE